MAKVELTAQGWRGIAYIAYGYSAAVEGDPTYPSKVYRPKDHNPSRDLVAPEPH